ncbi:MAG: multi-sensor signal transduction histidine kinase [Methanolobus sp. T82-4]|nr:MAG: multi-sensor signal transduction histidine kinase [Methanolobus sp. T82-4]
MNSEALIGIVNNAALLLALGLLYDSFSYKVSNKTIPERVITGSIIGIIGVALIFNSWELAPGIVFDTRSILLSITGLFFGFIPVLVAALISAIYRLSIGGPGVLTGISVIASSTIIGLLWRMHRQDLRKTLGKFELYVFGIIVHISMLLLMFTLPFETALEVLRVITIPVILVYPIGTVLLGTLLNQRTARNEAQQALRESEARIKHIYNNVPVGIFRTDSSGKVLSVNPEMAHIVGCDSPEEAKEHYTDLGKQLYVNSERREEFVKMLKKEGSVQNFEYEAQRKDGKRLWLLMNAKISAEAENGFVIDGFTMDITERKMADFRIRESEEKFRAIFEQAATGICQADLEGKIIQFNDRFCKITGYPAEELMKVNFRDITHPDDLPKELELVAEVVAGKRKNYSIEKRYLHKSGSSVWVSVNVSIVSSSEGRPLYFLAVAEDIAERKEAEEQMLRARLAAEEANRYKNELLANANHELRTPLSSIIGFSDIILSDMSDNLNQSQKKYLSHVNQSGKLLLKVISKMLDISRIESGGMDLHFEKFRPGPMVEEVIQGIESMASIKNITLNVDMDTDIQEMTADKGKVQAILYNLLENSLKFTPSKGEVTLKIREKGEYLQISVTDNGIGIQDKDIDRIFDPFVQVDGSSTRKQGGTGLGLMLVKEYASMHNGEVSVKSEYGRGSTFIFTIPVAPNIGYDSETVRMPEEVN